MNNLQMDGRSFFRRIDLNFVAVILVLNVIGLINLYSATHGASFIEDSSDRFTSQIVWLIGGWTIFLAATVIDYRVLLRMAWPIYFVNIAALVAVDVFGGYFYGAQRWLDLGFFRYQPSETMKLALVLVLASLLSRVQAVNGLSLRQLLWPIAMLVAPFYLVVKQPDLGTALLLLAISFAIIMFVGVRRSLLVVGVIILAVAIPTAWKFGLKPYQKNRILTFLYPETDPRGTGYNSIQSKIAVGSGKFLGKGFRKGTQSQLEFLPERHTDFIFSVLSEEQGFIGAVSTYVLFLILFFIGIRIASQSRDKVGALICVGVLAYLFCHVTINLGMVIGLLPIVGVPLPLLSYGGSSMLTTMLGLGLVSSVAYRRYLF
jgi:rod shape determining protein RodA